jgi:hypothetical protein
MDKRVVLHPTCTNFVFELNFIWHTECKNASFEIKKSECDFENCEGGINALFYFPQLHFFPIIDTRTVLILIDVSRAALFQVLAELHH